MQVQIQILAGHGPRFGTGHARRMRALREQSSLAGICGEIHFIENYDATTAEHVASLLGPVPAAGQMSGRSVLLLDARDLDPRPFAERGWHVVALDNRHACREQSAKTRHPAAIEFYDSLPHPALPLRSALDAVLIRPEVLALSDPGNPKDGGASSLFVYAGSFIVPGLLAPDGVLQRLREQGWRILVCGTELVIAPDEPGLTTVARLSGDEYLRALEDAWLVWTYFGMTLFEAWTIGRRPLLLPVPSAVHTELAADLARRGGLPLVSPLETEAAVRMIGEARRPDAGAGSESAPVAAPDGQGFARLVALLLDRARS